MRNDLNGGNEGKFLKITLTAVFISALGMGIYNILCYAVSY